MPHDSTYYGYDESEDTDNVYIIYNNTAYSMTDVIDGETLIGMIEGTVTNKGTVSITNPLEVAKWTDGNVRSTLVYASQEYVGEGEPDVINTVFADGDTLYFMALEVVIDEQTEEFTITNIGIGHVDNIQFGTNS